MPNTRLLRLAVMLAFGAAALLTVGCAHARRPGSYLPVGASSWYGDSTEDGVTAIIPVEESAAKAIAEEALQSTGYSFPPSPWHGRSMQTSPRQLGGDTSMVVKVQILPVELPEPASVIVLTGTYSVPSQRLRNAPAVRPPGTSNAPYARLGLIIQAVMNRPARAP